MKEVDRAYHEALLEVLRQNDRLIWFMAKQAGGKVTIDAATLAAYDERTAFVMHGHDPDSGGPMIEAVTLPHRSRRH
jgi:hypothetical protein